jgi:hypothetical protein
VKAVSNVIEEWLEVIEIGNDCARGHGHGDEETPRDLLVGHLVKCRWQGIK